MRESVTYQAILEEGREEGRNKGRIEGREEGRNEGRVEGERDSLLRVGRKRLGEPPVWVPERIAGVKSKSEIEALIDRALDVESWNELFDVGD